MKIYFDAERLKIAGSRTILGLIRIEKLQPNEEIELLFADTPRYQTLPSYVIPCLMEDLQWLMNHDIKVVINTYTPGE